MPSMQFISKIVPTMGPKSKLRKSEVWGAFAEEQFTPKADLLTPSVRLTRKSALPWALVLVLSVLAGVGAFGQYLTGFGQWNACWLALLLPLTVAMDFTHRRYGANPPQSLLLFILGIAALPSALIGIIGATLVPAVRHFFELIGGPWLGGLAGLAIPLTFALYLAWRSRILRGLRDQVMAAQERTEIANNERNLAEARLQALQGQIEPHFLYNTLANVQHLIARQPTDAEAMLTGLIRYLRESLPKMRDSCSTVGQEIALSTAYLDIARIRLGSRLTVEVHLPEDLQACPFPPLVIQTLVENALKHGAEPKVSPTTIRIAAETKHNEVCIVVADDGVGLGEVQGTGVGLRNTRERLTAIYGPKAKLILAPNTPSGVVAKVCIPKESP